MIFNNINKENFVGFPSWKVIKTLTVESGNLTATYTADRNVWVNAIGKGLDITVEGHKVIDGTLDAKDSTLIPVKKGQSVIVDSGGYTGTIYIIGMLS